MLSVIQSPEAEADLDAIWLYIALDNVGAADATIDRILDTYHKLAQFPQMGTHTEQLPGDLLRFPVGSYLVIYRITQQLEIVRVLHGAQDIETILQQD